MRVPCKTCEGYGEVISERSLRDGHTHPNDPDRYNDECEECGGAGAVPATASDLDGQQARYLWLTGTLTWVAQNDTLSIETDDGVIVMNLQPEHVQCLS